MTEQQEYDIFMIKLGNTAREINDDYSKLSNANKRRFVETYQTYLKAKGLVLTSEMIRELLRTK